MLGTVAYLIRLHVAATAQPSCTRAWMTSFEIGWHAPTTPQRHNLPIPPHLHQQLLCIKEGHNGSTLAHEPGRPLHAQHEHRGSSSRQVHDKQRMTLACTHQVTCQTCTAGQLVAGQFEATQRNDFASGLCSVQATELPPHVPWPSPCRSVPARAPLASCNTWPAARWCKSGSPELCVTR
jgi:hypothetical protein